MRILVFNCGSSSLKFELIEIQEPSRQPASHRRLARGIFEEIGRQASFKMNDESGRQRERSEPISDHKSAAIRTVDWLDELGYANLDGVAHRVVHGGAHVTEPVIANDVIIGALRQASEFAPLHNPPAISVI